MVTVPRTHAHARSRELPPGRSLTGATEDYLKAIWELAPDGAPLGTSELARAMGVTPASVTGMLRALARRGLVSHARYRGTTLTPSGRAAALAVVRAHRLLELLLADRLGVPLEEVHEEAERLEHALSPALTERIDALLGRPAFDPHGAPIPGPRGELAPRSGTPLSQLAPGERAVVIELRDDNAALVRYARELGLLPGARLTVAGHAPFGGPLTLRVDGQERVLGGLVLEHVLVRRESKT
jgi:DtxR family Mn-dependent transcriptional regulator